MPTYKNREVTPADKCSYTPALPPKRFLVTGVAGFIAGHLCEFLLRQNLDVVGIDNINSYYDRRLKCRTLQILHTTAKASDGRFKFHAIDLRNADELDTIFESDGPFDCIIHLAAQAGVRYSVQHPADCVDNNVIGTLNMLEFSSRYYPKSHFIMASSSSVYGCDSEAPFEEKTAVCNRPFSVYAASKKSAEMLCHSYNSMYNLPITMFRFFTVYGPRGRPDMAVFKFIESVVSGKELPLFGNGSIKREFTYISDIIDGLLASIQRGPSSSDSRNLVDVFNIGGGSVHTVMELIETISAALGHRAKISFHPEQLGDVPLTVADLSHVTEVLGFAPKVSLQEGIQSTVEWYLEWTRLRESESSSEYFN